MTTLYERRAAPAVTPVPRSSPAGPLLALLWAGAAAVVALWWTDTGSVVGTAGWLTGGGRIAGLLCGYSCAVLVGLMARVPLLERRIGSDRVARWHAMAGRYTVCLLVALGPAARGVYAHRARLISQARPHLADARRVAALDVGWVGAATPASIVDLAGITDPAVAVLPGGHTSKRLPVHFLKTRRADHLVLLLAPGERLREPWQVSAFDRVVEQRVGMQPEAAGYQPVGQVALGGTQQSYVILALKDR